MITKIYASLEALDMGVSEVIISSGLIEKPISSAIENKCGTVIRRE
jgi:acetylglutamate kinase